VVNELVNVMEQEVKVEGAFGPILGRHARHETERYIGGGHFLALHSVVEGEGAVELRQYGRDTGAPSQYLGFGTFAAAQAEFARLKALLFTRQWVEWVLGTLDSAGIVPRCFHEAIRAGDLDTLVIAADWHDERDNPNAAMLLRAAYHRIRGEANVRVGAGKGKTIVLNPHAVTKRSPAEPGVGVCRAVVVENGKSVRIVSVARKRVPAERSPGGPVDRYVDVYCVEERIFRTGDQAEYGSYNLVYFGMIDAITAKTVTVLDDTGSDVEVHRLSLAKFV
jgi:hypothetical protein